MKRPILTDLSNEFSTKIIGNYTWFPEIGLRYLLDDFEPDKSLCTVLGMYKKRKNVYGIDIRGKESLSATIIYDKKGGLKEIIVKSLRTDLQNIDDFVEIIKNEHKDKVAQNELRAKQVEADIMARFGITLDKAMKIEKYFLREVPTYLKAYLERKKNTP